MEKKPKKTREAKPGELREIRLMELFERLSRRPESRLDLQRFFEKVSPACQVYVKHLITSGPSSIKAAAKACGLKTEEVETALAELEQGISKLRA